MVSARILQNGISSLLEACLQKRLLISFCIIVVDNQSPAIKPIKPTTNSHIVKFLETQFRLKGFGAAFFEKRQLPEWQTGKGTFSKRCEEKLLQGKNYFLGLKIRYPIDNPILLGIHSAE